MTDRTIRRAKTGHQGGMERNMELTISRSSFVFLLTLGFLLNAPKSSNGLCNIRKNGTLARCNYFEDVKTIDSHQLKSLKISAVYKHLSDEYFSNLTSLRHLDLSNGKLKKVEPGSFRHLQNLRSLDLSNNHLAHLEPGALIDLQYLQILNLSTNLFHQIPNDISNLKDLKMLDLSNNRLLCDCKTLKTRDILRNKKVEISKKTSCLRPNNLKGQYLIDLKIHRVCMFDELELEERVQMDQPSMDEPAGSGEDSGDPFDEIESEDIPDDDEQPTEHPGIIPTTVPEQIPLTPKPSASSTDDELFFTEETNKYIPTLPISEQTETVTEASIKMSTKIVEHDKTEWNNEGSGDDDLDDPWMGEGSGFEGSGVHIPHIIWDEEPTQTEESHQPSAHTTSTTESEGIIDTLYSIFWGTSAPPTSTTEEIDLEEEQFIKASTESPVITSSTSDAELIVPIVVNTLDVEKKPGDEKSKVLDDSKSGQVKAESPNESSESADAAAAQQSKKGMGSYVVLAVLLGVLAILIGFAAYKGDFCKERRKRNNPNIEASDVENGTELKDLRKSLLENSNSVQPKISTNGKPEEAPLVPSSASPGLVDDEPSTKYVGTLSESSADPVKPPRKSFSPYETESGKTSGTNGQVSTVPHLSSPDNIHSSRIPIAKDVLVNGKNDRDSLSSVGESPSSGSHSTRLSNSRLSHVLPPASPGAQRVKITLQDNPDSVPKTPLLITRTRAGENLVKTP